MKRTTLVASLAAIAMLGFGLDAGAGNPLGWYTPKAKPFPAKTAAAQADKYTPPSAAGWEFVGGDSMWALKQHKYTLGGAMADDCTLHLSSIGAPKADYKVVDPSPGG